MPALGSHPGRGHPPARRAAARPGRATRHRPHRRAAARPGRRRRVPQRERGGRLPRRPAAGGSPRRRALVAHGRAPALDDDHARHAAAGHDHRRRPGHRRRGRPPAGRAAGRGAAAAAARLRAAPRGAHRGRSPSSCSPGRSATRTRCTCGALRRTLRRLLPEEQGRLAPALADPAGAAVLGEALHRPLVRVAGVLAAGREAVAAGASTEQVLWALWAAAGLAPRWEAASRHGGVAGAAADRDLDAVVQLFDAAAAFTDRLPHLGPGAFAEYVAAQQIPGHPRPATSGAEPDAVAVLTAHASKGLEWDLVCVAHVQEGSWPDLRRRGSLLGTEELVDADPRPRRHRLRPSVAAQLAEERRLFYVAATRARRQLVVTAVAGEDEQPSRLLDELDPVEGDRGDAPPGAGRPPAGPGRRAAGRRLFRRRARARPPRRGRRARPPRVRRRPRRRPRRLVGARPAQHRRRRRRPRPPGPRQPVADRRVRRVPAAGPGHRPRGRATTAPQPRRSAPSSTSSPPPRPTSSPSRTSTPASTRCGTASTSGRRGSPPTSGSGRGRCSSGW